MEDSRRHQVQVLRSNGDSVIGVRGFEAKTMRLGDSQSSSKSTEGPRMEQVPSHPVIQRAAYFSQLNSAERWPHLSNIAKKEKTNRSNMATRFGTKPSMSAAKALLANLSLDAVLVEDTAL